MDTLFIIMPAYNEEENIHNAIAQWHPIAERISPDSRLVVIDDGSRDHTLQAAQNLKKAYPQLIVLTKENQGHGATVLYGYKYAILKGADYVFQTDSDGQTLPSEFSVFWKNRRKCGLLIGCRIRRQDGLFRIFVTRVLQMALLISFRIPVRDANTPYRLMRCEELQKVLCLVPRNFFLSNVLITVIYTKQHLGVHYYPITFLERQNGRNSINMKKIIQIGSRAFCQFWRLRKKIQPEHSKQKSLHGRKLL
ncbi:glycosyltransferase family 2 protein [Petralouisia muris]|jgi:glycosyltransferase involved in cell wall biosynthesis|uniref:Glycosyltransferase family 2 protein n=1 Tax=Petralouisia muris TaxID=3032872 RepID=A0AC61RTK1_9FIRM|nr:glycosyltransferase family 2 protein [Petralouisia muris]TGY93691.1 glycosyltransferase family 2 protein [Petralouisia muris]